MRYLFIFLLFSFIAMPAFATSRLAPHRHATKARHASPGPSLDKWIKAKLDSGDVADLDEFCAARKAEKGAPCSNALPAALVRGLLLDASSSARSSTHDITFRHATIVGDLDIGGTSIARGVAFVDTRFLGKVGLRNCTFTKDLAFEHTSFEAGLSAARLKVGGDLRFLGPGDWRGGDVDLVGADIALSLYVRDIFADEGVTFNAAGAKLHASAEFSHVQLVSGLKFENAAITGALTLDHIDVERGPVEASGVAVATIKLASSNFRGNVDFSEGKVTGDVLVDELETDGNAQLDLSGAKIDGDIKMSGVTMTGKLDAQLLVLKGSLDLGSDGSRTCRFADVVDLREAKISGGLHFKNATLDSFSGRGVDVDGNLVVGPQTTLKGIWDITSAKVGGDLRIEGATFQQPFKASLAHFTDVFLHEHTTFHDEADFVGAHVAAHLDVGGSSLRSLDLTRADIGGDLRLAHAKRQQNTTWDKDASSLVLRYARVGVIQDEVGLVSPDPWPAHIDVEGLAFDHFGREHSVEWAERWLAKERLDEDGSEPSVQPYVALANYFKTDGRDEASDAIKRFERDRERLRWWQACSLSDLPACSHVLGLSILKYLIGYGIGNGTFLVLVWVATLTVVGAIVLERSDELRARGHLWCLGASLSHLLPVIELNKEFADVFDDPNRLVLRSWQLAYFGVHAIMGYAFASFVVAALSGLTQAH